MAEQIPWGQELPSSTPEYFDEAKVIGKHRDVDPRLEGMPLLGQLRKIVAKYGESNPSVSNLANEAIRGDSTAYARLGAFLRKQDQEHSKAVVGGKGGTHPWDKVGSTLSLDDRVRTFVKKHLLEGRNKGIFGKVAGMLSNAASRMHPAFGRFWSGLRREVTRSGAPGSSAQRAPWSEPGYVPQKGLDLALHQSLLRNHQREEVLAPSRVAAVLKHVQSGGAAVLPGTGEGIDIAKQMQGKGFHVAESRDEHGKPIVMFVAPTEQYALALGAAHNKDHRLLSSLWEVAKNRYEHAEKKAVMNEDDRNETKQVWAHPANEDVYNKAAQVVQGMRTRAGYLSSEHGDIGKIVGSPKLVVEPGNNVKKVMGQLLPGTGGLRYERQDAAPTQYAKKPTVPNSPHHSNVQKAIIEETKKLMKEGREVKPVSHDEFVSHLNTKPGAGFTHFVASTPVSLVSPRTNPERNGVQHPGQVTKVSRNTALYNFHWGKLVLKKMAERGLLPKQASKEVLRLLKKDTPYNDVLNYLDSKGIPNPLDSSASKRKPWHNATIDALNHITPFAEHATNPDMKHYLRLVKGKEHAAQYFDANGKKLDFETQVKPFMGQRSESVNPDPTKQLMNDVRKKLRFRLYKTHQDPTKNNIHSITVGGPLLLKSEFLRGLAKPGSKLGELETPTTAPESKILNPKKGLPMPEAPTLKSTGSMDEAQRIIDAWKRKIKPKTMPGASRVTSVPTVEAGKGWNNIPVSTGAIGKVVHRYDQYNLHGTRLEAHLNKLKNEVPAIANDVDEALAGPGETGAWSNKLGVSPFKTIKNKLTALHKNAVQNGEPADHFKQWRDAYNWDKVAGGVHTDQLVHDTLHSLATNDKDRLFSRFIKQYVPTLREGQSNNGGRTFHVARNFTEQMNPEQSKIWNHIRGKVKGTVGGLTENKNSTNIDEQIVKSLFRNAVREQNLNNGTIKPEQVVNLPSRTEGNVERFRRRFGGIKAHIHPTIKGKLAGKFKSKMHTRHSAVEVEHSEESEQSEEPEQYALRAPEGGIVVREGQKGKPGQFYHGGIWYPGGQVIPNVGAPIKTKRVKTQPATDNVDDAVVTRTSHSKPKLH